MKLSEYARKIGVTYQTAWRHFHKGLIPGAFQLSTGTVVVPNDVIARLSENLVCNELSFSEEGEEK